MKRSMSVWFAALIGCFAIFTLALEAQTFYGSIVGAVTDSSGAMLPGATVTLVNLGTT